MNPNSPDPIYPPGVNDALASLFAAGMADVVLRPLGGAR